MQAVKAVSEPTSHELWGRGAGCLNGVATYLPALCCRGAECLCHVGTYLPSTVLLGCRLFKWCPNLPPMNCGERMQAVKAVQEPTCRGLCCRGTGCLSDVGLYLPGTVLQGCRLLKQCRNLPAKHFVAGVQDVLVVPEPTCRALCCRGAGCLNSVATFLSALCCRNTGCLSRVGTYLLGTLLQRCRMFKRC